MTQLQRLLFVFSQPFNFTSDSALLKVYNTTFIRWTTHSPPGLSAKDVAMAAFCDSQAAALGEIVQEHTKEVESNVRNETGRDLVDHVAAVGGDCCLPKSNR